MLRTRYWIGVPVAVLATSLAANAQAASNITLAQAIDQAHHINPSLLSAQQHAAAVQAGELTASLRQNPILNIGSTQANLPVSDQGGPYFYNAGLSRVFERGGKRDLRIAQARGNTAVAQASVQDQQRGLDLAVKQAFTRMLAAKEAVAVSEENLTDYRRTVDLMKVRLDAGDVSKTDFARIDLQLASFEADTDNSRLALQQASYLLQTLLGVAQPQPGFDIDGTLDAKNTVPPLDTLKQNALTTRPDVLGAQKQIEANQAAVKLAVAGGKADPTLGGEYERSGNANTFGFTVNMPLRVFDRNQGEKERAKSELESSRLALTATQNQALSDVASAYAQYETSVRLSDRFSNKYEAEAQHVRDNLQFSYRNGNTTLLDYLSALRDYRQIHLQSIDARAQVLLAIHQLSYAANTEILP